MRQQRPLPACRVVPISFTVSGRTCGGLQVLANNHNDSFLRRADLGVISFKVR